MCDLELIVMLDEVISHFETEHKEKEIKNEIECLCTCDVYMQKGFIFQFKDKYDITTIICDGCNSNLTNEQQMIYFCPMGEIIAHTSGYFLCMKCTDKRKPQSICDDSLSCATLSYLEADTLEINDMIDHRNTCEEYFGLYLVAMILDKNGTNLKIHYYELNDNKYDIWSDYTKNINLFAKICSISQRKPNRLKHLKIGDYVDINPLLRKHKRNNNWLCGIVKDFVHNTGQLVINYKWNNEIFKYCTHIDNEHEIAKFGTKCSAENMLKNHCYNAYITLNKDKKTNFEAFKEICKIIINKTMSAKWKQNQAMMMEYLYNLYRELYTKLICITFKNDDNHFEMVNIFNKMYGNILKQLNFENETLHLQLTKNILSMNENIWTKKLNKSNQQIINEINVKWLTMNQYFDDNDIKEDNAFECLCIERITYLLDLFDKYFINYVNNNSDSFSLDFIFIFNHCINNNNQYKISQIIDDVNHIKYNHMNDILHKMHLMENCNHKTCVMKKRESESQHFDSYFGYSSKYDINIIKQFVKLHIYFKHKQILNPLAKLDRINNNKQNNNNNERYTKFSKFTTPIINDSQSNINNKNEMNEFKFGIRFYYGSDYYETEDSYISKPYFGNLKEELLNNSIYNLKLSIFNIELINAMNHSLTKKIKQLKAQNHGLENKKFYILVDSPINISQILSIILYTNRTKLQYKFKKMGCRKIHQNETIENVKKRNQQIGNWYQLFWKTVFFYGNYITSKQTVYHGISLKLFFLSFNTKFNCPISTTTSFTVAKTFAKNGIVLKLRPNADSRDKCFDVSFISDYPQEEERIFAFATQLFIDDVRFDNFNISYKNHLSSFRLFDYILRLNTKYPYDLIAYPIQQMLIKYLKNETSIDQIYEFNKTNSMNVLNDFIFNELEYDTDALIEDLKDCNNSNVMKQVKLLSASKQFQTFYETYTSKIKCVPQYLQSLFNFMMRQMITSINESNKIFIIESEYNKLDTNLQNILNSKIFNLCKNNICFISEFTWKITGDEFETFKEMPVAKALIGPDFECKLNDGSVIFYPLLQRASPSFVDHCGLFICIKSILSQTISSVQFQFSFSVKELNYSIQREALLVLKEGQYKGYKAFENNLLNDIEILSIQLFVRL